MTTGHTQRDLGLASDRPAAPFLKWAGGKSKLVGQLEPLLPPEFGRYIEPFVGGGAVFFHLHNTGRLAGGAVLADLNAELMNCYRVVQDHTGLAELIERLRRHARHALDKDYYYRVRAWDRKPGYANRGPAERAARTIFLNKTCYNGLYRQNSKAQFNVPYGKWSRPPRVLNEANLHACDRALQAAELHNEGFEACLDWARPGDFVYLDPPYDPLSPTASFTTYTGATFGRRDQERVASVFRDLDGRGCRLLLSNSDTPLIRRLYQGFRSETILARRAINSNASRRGPIPELAVMNY